MKVGQFMSNSATPTDGSLPRSSSVQWDFPGKNTGMGCHSFLLGIFPTLGSNPCLLCLLHCSQFFTLIALGETSILQTTYIKCINLMNLEIYIHSYNHHSNQGNKPYPLSQKKTKTKKNWGRNKMN